MKQTKFDKRESLAPFCGERRLYSALFIRHGTRPCDNGFQISTLLFRNICLDGTMVASHQWIDESEAWAHLNLVTGDVVQFFAMAVEYQRKYLGKTRLDVLSYGLADVKGVAVREPSKYNRQVYKDAFEHEDGEAEYGKGYTAGYKIGFDAGYQSGHSEAADSLGESARRARDGRTGHGRTASRSKVPRGRSLDAALLLPEDRERGVRRVRRNHMGDKEGRKNGGKGL